MKKILFLLIFLFAIGNLKGQYVNTEIVLNELPDTIVMDDFFDNLNLGFAIGSNYEPDTLKLFYKDSLVTLIAIPKASVSSISENVTTLNHNGSGYTLDNGFGITNDFGYYLKDNQDGTFQINDWTESLSGDIISAASFGNQAPFEFEVIVMGQDSFFNSNMNTMIGEVEVYSNGIRLKSSEFSIDTSGTGIILNSGLSIGDYLIIDID